jgi:hypothetical protein
MALEHSRHSSPVPMGPREGVDHDEGLSSAKGKHGLKPWRNLEHEAKQGGAAFPYPWFVGSISSGKGGLQSQPMHTRTQHSPWD